MTLISSGSSTKIPYSPSGSNESEEANLNETRKRKKSDGADTPSEPSQKRNANFSARISSLNASLQSVGRSSLERYPASTGPTTALSARSAVQINPSEELTSQLATSRLLDREKLMQGLEDWINNPQAKGKKIDAVAKIIAAFDSAAEKLFLDKLEITQLPECICLLANLRKLNLSNNKIEELPSGLGKLKNLEKLYLSDNQIKIFPSIVENLTQLRKLDLSKNTIEVVPSFIGNLIKLKKLILYQNLIKVLPPSIGDLVNLNELDLGDNEIVELPPFLGDLTQLTFLELSDNCIKVIPPALRNLKNLLYLHLEKNAIETLPEFIGQLSKLLSLYLNDNQLKELPSTLGELVDLLILTVHNNPELSSVPIEIFICRNLEPFDITGTKIKSTDKILVTFEKSWEVHMEKWRERQN